jgi:hypothetical protein
MAQLGQERYCLEIVVVELAILGPGLLIPPISAESDHCGTISLSHFAYV